VDGRPWSVTFGDMVSDLTFSPDGRRIAALGKEKQKWTVAVDGQVWNNTFDMAWRPVFSPDNSVVAAKVEKNGKYTYVVNDRLWPTVCDMTWDPRFSADGKYLLLRSLEEGVFHRRVVPVADIAG